MAQRAVLFLLVLLASPAPDSLANAPPHLFVLGSNPGGSACDVLDLSAPWTATLDVEPVDGGATLRHFFGLHYVVHPDTATIQVIDPASFDTIRTFPVGAGSSPRDILVTAPDRAYVTRYESTLLYQVDPTTGAVTDTIDLAGFADRDGLPEMSMMALDGNRLFVQIQRIDRSSGTPVVPSQLAVVDIRTNALIDVDPSTPGIQGVILTGTVPSFRMQVDPVARRLYVSTPARRLDTSGGIDEVDLDTLQSLGFVLSEDRLSVDLGGFVMITPDQGFAIGHTDIVASSHLGIFHRDPGVPGQGEIYTTLGAIVDTLAYDEATHQLFYPDPTTSPPGIQVFDTLTGARLTTAPVATTRPPADLVVARDVTPGEPGSLEVTGLDAVTGEMSLAWQPACGATNHNLVYGPLSDVGAYGYDHQLCGIGMSGQLAGFDPGPGSWFFVVVGTDGAAREGSYGLDSHGIERPEDLLDPVCSFAQELTLRCD